ncbi:MAG: hypothetical protein MSC31_08730 [Solirubrobacteraceae bacterium MAG38_C4-C5]|nr:hypothetical protein [Candidatus Siliceabacter maunaloa]
MKFGQEAREFMERYALREDAIAYAASNPAVDGEQDEQGYREVFGHDPDGRRFRMILRGNVIVHVRPVPDDDR